VATPEEILVVDDDPAILGLIELLLVESGYRCTKAESAEEARQLAAAGRFSLALCDMTMPNESGLDLVVHLSKQDPELAVVMVTGVDDPGTASLALENGAYGYVVKPFTANVLRIAVVNALHRRRLELENRRHRERLAELVQERTAEFEDAVARLAQSEQALRRSREEAIQRLAKAVALRDGETGSHIERMSTICGRVARTIGLPQRRCDLIRIASPLHDVGKIGIPDSILLNPNPLTPREWQVIRKHPEIGYRMLSGSGEELLDLAATMALTHHERMDGSGYPQRLRGNEIPIEGRIAAVADVFDALTSDRVYQPARPLGEALEIMVDGRGTSFDPRVLDAFLALVESEPVLARANGSAPVNGAATVNGSARSDAGVRIVL
jgi:putative two-component system response regulator